MEKAPGAFRTISEVADGIDVPQHVLRFWESRFAQIRPMKRGGGRRFYRPEDVDLLRGVRHLLYGEGYTIRGVQRILREQGAAFVQNVWRAGAESPPPELQEDRAAEDAEPPTTAERSDPDLSVFSLPPPRARDSTSAEHGSERREPKLALAPAGTKPQRTGVTDDDRRKLQATLDELVACRRLIEAALANTDPAEQNGVSANLSAR
ncbi:MAG: MerR family transcriptional regulator [Xanthobacteraceae bacterium]